MTTLDRKLRSTDKCELFALFGLMYFRGLLGLNNHAVDHVFSERAGHPVFAGAVSQIDYLS